MKKEDKEVELLMMAAMASNTLQMVELEYKPFLDEHGYIPFYEMMLEIHKELFEREDSVYQTWINLPDKQKENWYPDNHDNMMDWYYMAQSREAMKLKLKLEL